MRRAAPRGRRRGVIAPLAAILLMVLVSMAAFSVDVGYMTTTQAELQNAADAAALAGASKLLLPQVQSPLSSTAAGAAVTAANAEAKRFSVLNRGGGVYLQLGDADIVVGYQATPGSGTLAPWSSGQPFPNTVQVTVRRDTTLNRPLDLFFGPAIGTPKWSSRATAAASYQAGRYSVTGFSSTPGGAYPLLLPIGVDLSFWTTFVQTGKSPDGVVHDSYTAVLPTTGLKPPANITSGPDNVPELGDVYPNRTSPGNFGLVNLNYTNPSNNTPQFSSWILNGPSPADIATFGPNGFQATPSAPATIKGGPGWKSALMTDLNAIIGQPRILPIFSSYTGQGSNTYYTIVGFAGVTVVKATGRGSNEDIAFQPLVVIDPTATLGTSGTSSISQFVYPVSPLGLTR